MNSLAHGLSSARGGGPTLKSTRSMRNLAAALHEIKHRPVGIDQIPYEAYIDPLGYLRWDPNLLDAHPDLNPLRTVQDSLIECPIPDASVAFWLKKRYLERGTVENRIRERAITRKLNFTMDRYFSDRSFGFRPGRSCETAILQVREAVRAGFHWALKTDIESFFDHVDRGILEKQLRNTFADQTLCDAILVATSPAVVVHGTTLQRQNGLPQGNGLSPWLSNLYLNHLDEACAHLKYFRYADDLLILAGSWREVVQAYRCIRGLARLLRLRLNPQKTIVCDLYRKSLVFLGYELRGGNIYPPGEAIHRLQQKLEFRGLGDQEQLMKGFAHRYRIGPVRKLFRRLDRQLRHCFPPGLSLLSLLEAIRQRERGVRRGSKGKEQVRGQLRRSHGQGSGIPDEKAHSGSPPRPAEPGATSPNGDVAPALRETTPLIEEILMRSPEYLNFIRTRPCSFCGNPTTEPHHCIKRLPGISEARLAQKGSDHLAIPVCHKCHEKIRDGRLKPSREEYLELSLINLTCYLNASQKRENPATVDAAVPLGG